MQNIKLLDLQTGKYLELGKEWGYFGEYITLIQIHTKTLIGTPYTRPLSPTHAPDYPTIQVEEIVNESKVCIYNHTNPIINQVAGKVGAVVYGGRYVLFEEKSFNYKPYEEIANKIILLYDKAMLYFNDERCNKLNQKKHNELNEDENKYFDSIYFSSYEFKEKCEKITESYGKRFCVDDRILPERYCKNEVYAREEAYNMILNDVKKHCTYIKNIKIQYSNIFEEYSRQLRNEPNKFEELMELIK